MIIDILENAGHYFTVHPLFAPAFEHIRSLDLEAIEPGRYELDGENLFFMITDRPALPAAEAVANFECHDKYIDIQLCISGKEKIGWKPRSSCTQQRNNGEPANDFVFFDDYPDMYFQLIKNQFAIFFPGDVHAPMIGEGMIRKLLMKIKL